MPKTDQTGVPCQNHQAHTGKRPYQHIGEFAKQVLTEIERSQNCSNQKRAIPGGGLPVLEQPQVVLVIGFEVKSH